MFDIDFLACYIEKSNIEFDKPIYVGFIVLELSKEFTYDFYYNKLR